MASLQSYRLADLAQQLGAELRGDPELLVDGLANLQTAEPSQLSFLANPAYQKYLSSSQAAAVLVVEESANLVKGSAIIVKNPYLAYAQLSALFSKERAREVGIHPSAVIDPSAQVDASACIGALVCIEAGAIIEANVRIDAGTVVGSDSVIGADTHLYPNVSIYHGITLGQRCIIHSGTVIGSDGFGFAPKQGAWEKIHQIGGVIIGDDVEVGANTAIDRGALDNTVISNGVKIDNQVHIAHNVEVGENTAIAGCSGVSGSTKIGKNCILAGNTLLAGHLDIADGCNFMGNAVVTKSVREAGVYSSGAGGVMPTKEWRKNAVRFRQLDDMAKRLKNLERKSDQ